METVDGLVGGAEGVGEGVEGFEGQQGLDGELGGGDEAEALGYVGVVWGMLELTDEGRWRVGLLTGSCAADGEVEEPERPRGSEYPFIPMSAMFRLRDRLREPPFHFPPGRCHSRRASAVSRRG